MEEGAAAMRLKIPIRRKIWRMELMKRSSFAGSSWTCTPAKIAYGVLIGTLAAIIAKAIPRLSRNPVLTKVEDIPDAIPLRFTGAAFMIEAAFGATKIPAPAPARIIGRTSRPYDAPKGKLANQKKAAEEIKSPVVLKLRAPYLSERNPLSGPNVTKAIGKGIRRGPWVRGSSPKGPWK